MSQTTSHVRVIPDQVYSRAGGVARLADVYIPSVPGVEPSVVIWLHGGGWRFGDRHLAPDLKSFAAEAGLAVVSIDYRLSDEATFPAAVVDVKTAVRWVRGFCPAFGLNGRRVGLWGSSAGGHLASVAALSTAEEFRSEEHAAYQSNVDAVVDGYGPTNFGLIDQERTAMAAMRTDAESRLVGEVLPVSHPDSFESKFLGVAVRPSLQEVTFADPVHYVRPDAPPFLILHGQADSLIPVSQSRYLFDALCTASTEATLVLLEKLSHGFFNSSNLVATDVGKVNVAQSPAAKSSARWGCDPSAAIVPMVSSFFRAHLAQ